MKIEIQIDTKSAGFNRDELGAVKEVLTHFTKQIANEEKAGVVKDPLGMRVASFIITG